MLFVRCALSLPMQGNGPPFCHMFLAAIKAAASGHVSSPPPPPPGRACTHAFSTVSDMGLQPLNKI